MRMRTRLAQKGRRAYTRPGSVNLPVIRASTVTFENVAELEGVQKRFDAGEIVPTYGITNMPLRTAFEELMVELEGGYRAATYASGLAANAAAIMACVGAGDHILVTDSVYSPVRRLCLRTLARYGIETTFYDPLIGAGIAELMKPNTKLVYCESPGSHTFEMQDVPAIAKAAHERGAGVIHDNAWATGIFYRSFDHGADIVVQPATKYPGGHSDILMGAVIANERWWPKLHALSYDLGQTASPDDLFLAIRGMRTLEARLRQHEKSALEIATKLQGHPKVKRVLYPALESDPGHALWKRDYSGATGLFGIELVDSPKARVDAFVDGLEHFAIGYSWGGFDSLIVPNNISKARSVRHWTGGPLLRISIGLEDPGDLWDDLSKGLDAL
jgi:cystathionine beta-lyase